MTTTTTPVLAATAWKSNAELIEACRDLGYLTDEQQILDPTYGHGVFWRNWKPAGLWPSDIDPAKSPGRPADFTRMLWSDDTFDAVVFDPPYKLNGTPSDSDERYGVHVHATTYNRLQLCFDGIEECARVLKPRGYLLIKCQDQVVAGHKVWQTHLFADHADVNGCELVDQLHLLTTPRPQPEGRRQVHSRQNYSTMLICRKRRR